MILLDKDLPTTPAELVNSPEEAQELIEQLEYELSMSKVNGVGLSSVQIGVMKACAIVRTTNFSINLINPRIIKADKLIQYTEGCLSFPDKWVKTVRYANVVIETADDYMWQAEQLNAKRSKRKPVDMPLFSSGRRVIECGESEEGDEEGRLVSIACQHETAHLLGLTFLQFAPKEVGRNDKCVCGSGRKNKVCCAVQFYNPNLDLLFKPNYVKGVL